MIDIHGKEWARELVIFNTSNFDEGKEILIRLFPKDYDKSWFSSSPKRDLKKDNGIIYFLNNPSWDRIDALEMRKDDGYEVLTFYHLRQYDYENSFGGLVKRELGL